MSTADKLNYLNETKEAIKTALVEKGVSVSDSDTFRSYADKIGEISSGGSGGSSNTYGLENLVGKVDDNGVLQAPTGANLTFTGVTGFVDSAMNNILRNNRTIKNVTFPDIVTLSGKTALESSFESSYITSLNFPNLETIRSGTDIFKYICRYCSYITSLNFPKLKTIKGTNLFYEAFSYTKLTEVNFPSLEELDGSNTLDLTFRNCTNLISVKLPKLYIVGSTDKMSSTFANCSSLQEIDLSSLKYVNGFMYETFVNCTSLTKVSFPSLERATMYGLQNIFRGCTALTEIHFRADAQSTIEGLYTYDTKFGATNATIYFDL